MSSETIESKPASTPRWRPIGAVERRVLGVLVEKAKTTPENYPLSLNALKTACNQKNNRSPQMQLEEPQVEEALDELRKVGAVLLVQGDSRVDRYRHLAYEWLGVDKVELAVMAELLLRGSQTVGELRGRAARMEPIKDMGELLPILSSLEAKRLMMYLTPHGRGAIITHTLYLDREMDKVRREASQMQVTESEDDSAPAPAPSRLVSSVQPITSAIQRPRVENVSAPTSSTLADEVQQLRAELSELKREFAVARTEWDSAAGQLRDQLDDLNRQLGNA